MESVFLYKFPRFQLALAGLGLVLIGRVQEPSTFARVLLGGLYITCIAIAVGFVYFL